MNDESLNDIDKFKREKRIEADIYAVLGMSSVGLLLVLLLFGSDVISMTVSIAVILPMGFLLFLLALNKFHVINFHLNEAFKKAREKRGIKTVVLKVED